MLHLCLISVVSLNSFEYVAVAFLSMRFSAGVTVMGGHSAVSSAPVATELNLIFYVLLYHN